MTKGELKERYFSWMCDLIYDRDFRSYKKLLRYLNSIEFTYILPMDANRASDGISLRQRFAYEEGYDLDMVYGYLDDKPCSVLEMMVALATRCEEDITYDPDLGDRKGSWFWDMIANLALAVMSDALFDEDYAYERIMIFLNREYDYYGQGGLFTVQNPPRDMRTVEIWCQMLWHLNDIIYN